MRKQKQICTFGKKEHEFNKVKRSKDVERAPRPKGNNGKPPKNTTTSTTTTTTISDDNNFDNVIYIELYGTTISGTMWNVNGPIIAEHSGLTEIEVDDLMARIQSHFAPYNVLVTNDIDIYNAAPYNKKQRVVITESNEWYGSNAGGVAYINSWGWGDQSPGWVFSKLLGYNVHNIGEAAAHEIGHILGCRHQVTCTDGVKTAEYNPGNGIIAPTMGVSYYVSQGNWWIGPNSLGCTIIQDDNQIITTKLGLKP